MEFIDAHTHLNDDAFFNEVDLFWKNCQQNGVRDVINAGADKKFNERTLQLAEQYDHMWANVGWYPENADEYTTKVKEDLIKQAQNKKVVALGEIGLDYHLDNLNETIIEQQKKVFIDQLDIAKQLHLPVVIHTRDAFNDTYQILKDSNIGRYGIMMHCFNGDINWLKKFLNLGAIISYSGIASFKNAHSVHESVKKTPLDSLVVETDAPYLTPEPYRGHRNEPSYVKYTAEAIAKLKNTTLNVIAENITNNAERFFGLDQ